MSANMIGRIGMNSDITDDCVILYRDRQAEGTAAQQLERAIGKMLTEARALDAVESERLRSLERAARDLMACPATMPTKMVAIEAHLCSLLGMPDSLGLASSVERPAIEIARLTAEIKRPEEFIDELKLNAEPW